MTPEVQKLKEELQTKGVRGLALDIDETLSDTNPHWFDHLFARFPLTNITRTEVLEKHKSLELVPGWGHAEVATYMNKVRHSNEFNESVPLIENANHMVNKMNAIVPIVVYVTARPESVRSGTGAWLKKHGFPSAEIIMRPNEDDLAEHGAIGRNEWKARTLRFLSPEVIGIVDDNIGLAQELTAVGYEGTLYLYGKQSRELDSTAKAVLCPDWESVVSAIENKQ